MPRRSGTGGDRTGTNSFRYEFVHWTPQQLMELRGWLSGNDNALESSLIDVVDKGWKLSISENKQTGRYLVSITDKWGRPGCKGISFGIEHSEVSAAIMGAIYYAVEIIGEGITEGDRQTVDDDW